MAKSSAIRRMVGHMTCMAEDPATHGMWGWMRQRGCREAQNCRYVGVADFYPLTWFVPPLVQFVAIAA